MTDSRNLKKEYDKLIAHMEKTNDLVDKANGYIRDGEEKEQLIGQLEKENQALKFKNSDLEATVGNMLRIQKERANTQRKLRPKRENPGYLVLSQESTVRQIYPEVKKKYEIYQTVIQSPFDAGLKMDFARKFYERDIYSFLAEDMKIYSYCPEIEIYKIDDCIRSSNQIVFTVNFRQNYRSGFYDIILYHNNEFEFPEYMKS